MGCLSDFNDPSRDELGRYCEFYKYIDYNKLKDINFKRRLYKEMLELSPLLKAKVLELIEKRNKATPVVIGIGNTCINPCYEYHPSLLTKCPKCGGKVEKDFENGYHIENRFNDVLLYYEDIKIYDQNICNEFTFNNKISKEDYDLKEFFNYFRKREELEGGDYREYLIVDGERFDAPTSITLEEFFKFNENRWFPQFKNPGHDNENTSFFIEGNRPELGQSLGWYGYKWEHFVFIYTCNSCGFKYHIMRTSPFRFRDKTKDNKITVVKKKEPENQESQKNDVNK